MGIHINFVLMEWRFGEKVEIMNFDYHLTPKEQQKVQNTVPFNQAKIHMAFRANIEINGKEYPLGGAALSEHMVTLYKKSLFGSTLTMIESIHMLSITSLTTTNDQCMKFTTLQETITVKSLVAMKFARNLLRNYILITSLFPPSMKFKFQTHNMQYFPRFDPELSPSQQVQFSYNANCSYFNTSYFHEAIQYFHSLITAGNGIYDITMLPIHTIECNLGDPIELRPLFMAFMYCPFIFGFCCYNVARPDLLQGLSIKWCTAQIAMLHLEFLSFLEQ